MIEDKSDLKIIQLVKELRTTQEIVDSLMLNDDCTSVFSLLRRNNKAMYIAMRIISKEEYGISEAHNAYIMFLKNSLFADLKNDVNEILKEHDKEYLIINIFN